MSNNVQFVISREITEAVEHEMASYLKASRANCVVLLSKSGHLISQAGYVSNFNLQSVAALIGGIFTSTQALARLVNEDKFRVMFQEGQKWNVYFCLISDQFILATIFDKSTVIGMIRHAAAEAEKALAPFLERSVITEESDLPVTPLGDTGTRTNQIAEPGPEISLPDLNKEVEDALSKLFS